MLTTTETLLKGLAEGNEGRWARFYRDYAPFLEDFVARKFPLAHEDAEEIVSDTLIDVAKMMPTYRYDKEKKVPSTRSSPRSHRTRQLTG